jgi:hypothetical protein
MITGFEYGYAQGQQTMWCIHKDGTSERMLCGRWVGFIPVVQPERPLHVHRDCLEAMYGTHKRVRSAVGYAVCPVCDGDAPVFERRIQAHGAWKIGADGEPYQSEQPCLGVNLKPRGRR